MSEETFCNCHYYNYVYFFHPIKIINIEQKTKHACEQRTLSKRNFLKDDDDE